MFNLSCATPAMHSSKSHTAKKMLSLEEIETQQVLELPDRQVMRIYYKDITIGAKPDFIFWAAKKPNPDIAFSAPAPDYVAG